MSPEEMIKELRDVGVMFDEDSEMPSELWLNMNDVFHIACADAEEVTVNDIASIYALWKDFGWEGVVWWVWKKRGVSFVKPVQAQVLEKVQGGNFVVEY